MRLSLPRSDQIFTVFELVLIWSGHVLFERHRYAGLISTQSKSEAEKLMSTIDYVILYLLYSHLFFFTSDFFSYVALFFTVYLLLYALLKPNG